MPLNLTAVSHGKVCHGSRWEIADEDDLAGKIALLALGQYRHVAAVLAGIDKKQAATRADTAAGAITLLTVPQSQEPYHRDGWIFQSISWIAAHQGQKGAVVRAPHAIAAHKGFDGMQLRLDADGETVTAVIIFEDKATTNPRPTIRGDVWKGIRALEKGRRMPELIQETGALLEANQLRFPNLDIDAAVETILWEEARHYRVSITSDDAHGEDVAREALFKGFDKVAPGKRERRQAETLHIPEMRKWMKHFATKVIGHIEAWRENV